MSLRGSFWNVRDSVSLHGMCGSFWNADSGTSCGSAFNLLVCPPNDRELNLLSNRAIESCGRIAIDNYVNLPSNRAIESFGIQSFGVLW